MKPIRGRIDHDREKRKILNGDFGLLGYVESPVHGTLRVLFSSWDSHYLIHCDNYDVELYVHTFVDIRKGDLTWERIAGIFEDEYAAFTGDRPGRKRSR